MENSIIRGYVKIALCSVNLSDEEKQAILSSLKEAFDWYSCQEAKEYDQKH